MVVKLSVLIWVKNLRWVLRVNTYCGRHYSTRSIREKQYILYGSCLESINTRFKTLHQKKTFSPLLSLSSLCLLSVTKGPGGLRHFSLNTFLRFPVVRKKMMTTTSSTQLSIPSSHHHIIHPRYSTYSEL